MNIRAALVNNKLNAFLYKYRMALFFIVPFILLLFTSHNSFLYAFNTSEDINCFVSCAKYIKDGKVLYRDIFEQKGPILYWFHVIGCSLLKNPYHGMFILEFTCVHIYLVYVAKTIELILPDAKHMHFLIPLLASVEWCFCSLDIYGQTEEYCLPLIMFAIYSVVKYMISRKDFSIKSYILLGVFTGIIFWSKYLVLVVYGICIITLVITFLYDKKAKEIGRMFLFGFCGFLCVTMPVLLYFAINHALPSLFDVYFIGNVRDYSSVILPPGTKPYVGFLGTAVTGLALFSYGLPYAFLILMVLAKWNDIPRTNTNHCLAFVILGYLFTAIGVSVGGFAWFYYFSHLFCWHPVLLALVYYNKDCFKTRLTRFSRMAILSVYIALSVKYTNEMFGAFAEIDNTMQYEIQCADMINESGYTRTSCIASMDTGFYYLTDDYPDRYYFSTVSSRKTLIMDSWIEDINAGNVDWVFVRWVNDEDSFAYECSKKCYDSCNLEEVLRCERFNSQDVTMVLYKNLDAKHWTDLNIVMDNGVN